MPKSSAGWGRAGHRRAVLIGAVVLVVVLGGGVAAWAEVGNGSAGYREATVTKADIGTSMTVVGNVDPVSDAAASFQVAGQVATVAVTPGQQVTAGQTLGTLQTTALSEAVSSAESTLAADQAKLVEDEENESAASSSSSAAKTPSLVDDHHDDRPHPCEQRPERHGHAGPDHADPGRVDAVDRPEQGAGRPGPGPERLHQRQHRHARRVRPPARPPSRPSRRTSSRSPRTRRRSRRTRRRWVRPWPPSPGAAVGSTGHGSGATGNSGTGAATTSRPTSARRTRQHG